MGWIFLNKQYFSNIMDRLRVRSTYLILSGCATGFIMIHAMS